MASKRVQNFLFGARHLRNWQKSGIHPMVMYYHSEGEESPKAAEEEVLPCEWYEMAFSKMKKWSHSLTEVDLIGGRLVKIDDHSRVFDDKLERRMHTFRSVAKVFIGLPSMQETVRKNLMASFPKSKCTEFEYFSRKNEREALTLSSLTKVADILSISAQQRKVVRHKICPQVTQHKIWNGALMEILNGLKSEIEVLIHQRSNKDIKLAQQIVVGCLKFLESSISYDPETTSWMRLMPAKGAESPVSPKWEDALEMSNDLVNCLTDEKELAFHVSKLEAMKEGLYQIRDVLIDKNIGYKEIRYQEHLVQKKLTKTLGHSSRCLFTLLLYYLYGNVKDVEIEVRGGLHAVGGGSKFCLYMGKVLTSDEEKVVWNGVRELDRALGLFKFVWETAGMKGDLELQGHMWCFGAENSSLPSSSERSSSSALHVEIKEGMESDDEIRRVPEIGGEGSGPTDSGRNGGFAAGPAQPSTAGSRKRGRSPADKENKRLKRLLRNRVSAQQARERKKAYVIDLEARVKELETKNAELDERLSTLQNENQMLRQILKNTTAGSKEGRK
ncbi:hypothetical protein BUALT_Bualt10G0135600 [Buddleja alternifolia]|uniref:Transcription factor HY5 n=1 Tax=Buddleja alternifolia TaxID=168488 RepID=A0AAV6X542_9LAMI|nr:hypothetical protein BUALT_Bualt10G0135600 [Buddleja alternifolia]